MFLVTQEGTALNLNNVLALRINPEGTLVAIIAFVPPAGEIAIEVYRPVLHPSSTVSVREAILNAIIQEMQVFDVTDYEKHTLPDEAKAGKSKLASVKEEK